MTATLTEPVIPQWLIELEETSLTHSQAHSRARGNCHRPMFELLDDYSENIDWDSFNHNTWDWQTATTDWTP